MSRSRIIFRVLLAVVLLGLCWVVGSAWLKSSSSGALAKAQQAMDTGDLDSAEIHLHSLLTDESRSADDRAQGHELMGELILAKAKQDSKSPDFYETNSAAREQLQTAAQLQPSNLPLQKKLLEVFLNRGALGAAAEVAKTVVEQDAANPDAVLALAIDSAQRNRPSEAEKQLDLYFKSPTTHQFRAYNLAVSLHNADEVKRAAAYDDAVTAAAKLTADELTSLPTGEQLIMASLLQRAIADAATAEVAHRRAAATLSVSEKIATVSGQQSPQLAEMIARVPNQLDAKFPAADLTAADGDARKAIASQAKSLLDGFVQAGIRNPLVYRQAALAAFNSRAYEEAYDILKAGIEACANLPPDQRAQLEELRLLAARTLIVMRRYQDAEQHLEVLRNSNDDTLSGWGQLLTGGVDSAEGRHGTALRHYQRAQGKLGRTSYVEIALAKTHLKLGNWDEALPRLQNLRRVLDNSDPEQQAWAQLHGFFSEQVAWDEFRALLALDRWEEAVEKLPQFAGGKFEPQAEVLAAGYLARKDRGEEALDRITTTIEKHPDSLPLLHTRIALLYLLKRNSEAEQAIDALANKDDLSSQLTLAHWRLRQGKQDEALKLLDSLGQRFPESTAPQLLKARLLLAMGKPREALAIGEALKSSPQTATTGKVIELMQTLHEQDLDKASEQLKELTDDAPSVSPQMSLLAGRLAAARGDLAKAIEEVGDSLDVTTMHQQAHLTLLQSIMALAAKESPQAAAEALAPLLARYPEEPFLHVVHADLLFKQQRVEEGLAALDRVERELPASPTAPYLKASTWSQLGNVEQALVEANRALAINDDYAPARLLAARLQLASGKPALALRNIDRVLKDNPRQWDAYFIKAEALRQLRRSREAIQTLTEALKSEPRFLAAYRGLMSLLLAENQADRALEVCRQARKAFPDELAFAIDEISILTSTDDTDAANELAESLVQGAEDKPYTEAAICLTLGQTYSAAGKIDLARKWGERALAAAEDDAEKAAAHLMLGELDLAAGTEKEDQALLSSARDHFAAVIDVEPRHFVAGNNLAWLLATEFNAPDQALAVAEQVRGDAAAADMPIGFIDTLAVVYRSAGQTDKARTLLEESVKRYADQPVLMFRLGVIFADEGKSTAASTLLERALAIGNLSDEHTAEAEQVLAKLAEPPAAPNSDQP